MTNLNTTTKKWIWNTWNQYQPDWFVTLLWNDLPTSEITSSSHTRHFRNLTLRKTTGSNSCSEIPDFPDRLGMTVPQDYEIIECEPEKTENLISIGGLAGWNEQVAPILRSRTWR